MKYVHLNNAGVAPLHPKAVEATEALLRATRDQGVFCVSQAMTAVEGCRTSLARLLGTDVEGVAMMPNCATSISQAAFGIPLSRGDRIVTWDQEYPSNAYPWFRAAERAGAEVRRVPSREDFSLDMGRLLEAIDARTKVVAISWVQFQTGATSDLPLVAAACRKVGAWLVVDAIQGLGVIPFEMDKWGVDVVCAGSHKWLRGPVGHGFLAVSKTRRLELEPVVVGAMTYGTPDDEVDAKRAPRTTARRFEPGAPQVFGAAGTGASVAAILEEGVELVHAKASRLSHALREGLLARGLRVLSPADSPSPIVTFVPRGEVSAFERALMTAGISCAMRAGGIRLAPHSFNTDDDIRAVFTVLDRPT